MPYFFGDSIAVGFGGKNPGKRVVGASPRQVYSYLQEELNKDPAAFQNTLINLSTGISNNPSDLKAIKDQFDLLLKAKAKVNILGAAQGTYEKQNDYLNELSKNYGFNFLGGFKPGRDRVHPESYSTYNGLNLNQVFTPQQNLSGESIANEEQFTPQETTEEKVIKVLAKYKGIAGELNKATGQFTEREWSPEETKRYEYYKGLNQ